MTKTLNNNFDIKKFFYENKYKFLLTWLFILIVYISNIYNLNTNYDTMDLLINQGTFTNWRELGRQGLIFSKIIFGTTNFNPYYAGVATMLAIFINLFLFSYIFKYFANIKTSISCLFFLIFLINPIWQEQFYFALQIFEIFISLILLNITVFITFYIFFNQHKNIYNYILFLINIALLVWLFSTYQSFVILYISMVVFIFIFRFRQNAYENKNNNKMYFKLCLYLLSTFFLAFIINTIITKIFFSISGYLTNEILWTTLPLKQCIKNILKIIRDVLFKKHLFFSTPLLISAILAFAAIIIDLFKFKNVKLKWLYVLAFFGLQLTPFLLTIYSANLPAMRSQIFLPFVTAMNFTIALNQFYKYLKIKYAILFIASVSILSQTQLVLRLQYTDYIRNMQDIDMVQKIALDIQRVTKAKDIKLAIVGSKHAPLNQASIIGESIGYSLFYLNSYVKPYYLLSSNSSNNMFKMLGYEYQYITEQDMIKARKEAKDLAIWPKPRSIKYIEEDNLVVVKISEDKYED